MKVTCDPFLNPNRQSSQHTNMVDYGYSSQPHALWSSTMMIESFTTLQVGGLFSYQWVLLGDTESQTGSLVEVRWERRWLKMWFSLSACLLQWKCWGQSSALLVIKPLSSPLASAPVFPFLSSRAIQTHRFIAYVIFLPCFNQIPAEWWGWLVLRLIWPLIRLGGGVLTPTSNTTATPTSRTYTHISLGKVCTALNSSFPLRVCWDIMHMSYLFACMFA